MRRTWLGGAAAAAATITMVSATAAQAATESGQQKTAAGRTDSVPTHTRQLVTWNMVAAALAKKLVGGSYIYGGTSPAGFDCSGLTQWVYKHTGHGRSIARTTEDQSRQFRRISRSAARPGDLVFFHQTSDPRSYVYHVGVYEGGTNMVAAATPRQGVVFQSFTWGGNTVTFGTITH